MVSYSASLSHFLCSLVLVCLVCQILVQVIDFPSQNLEFEELSPVIFLVMACDQGTSVHLYSYSCFAMFRFEATLSAYGP